MQELADKKSATALRKADNDYRFVLLPEAEERIQEYAKNRAKYRSIDEFLPLLIQQFGDFNKEQVNSRLKAAK